MLKFNKKYMQVMQSLNEGIALIYENQIGKQYPDVTTLNFLDLTDIKFIKNNTNIITETDENDIYQTKYFIEFFEKIKDIRYKEIFSDFTMKTIFKEIFERNKDKIAKHKVIFVLKFPFNKEKEFLKCINLINIYRKDIDINYYDEFFKTVLFKNWKNIAGLYIKDKSDEFSFIFLNSLSYNEDTIKHELIHYFQDILGISLMDNIEIIDKINMYGLCHNIEPELLFRQEEYVPFANEICYVFEKNEVKTSEQARDIIFKFSNHVLFNENYINKYIDDCKKLEEYKWFYDIGKQDFIEFYMLCYIYNYKNIENMRWIIENYFK